MSVVRIYRRYKRFELYQHSGNDSCGPLPGHLKTSTEPLLQHRSSFWTPDPPVMDLGLDLGRSSTPWMGTIHRRRLSGRLSYASARISLFKRWNITELQSQK